MNRRKEILLKLLIVSSLYTAILGLSTIVHKDDFNGDKLKVNKKAKVVKVVKKDNFSTFMGKVKQGEIKRVAERKAKIEKQRQVELKRLLLEKKKAKEKAEKVRLEKARVEKVKEEKRIAKQNKTSPSRGNSGDSGNYNTTFNCTWYTDLNGNQTSSGKLVGASMCASNSIPQGSYVQLEGMGRLEITDCGGSDLNSGNRLDIFLVRQNGESDSHYNNRALELGRQQIRGYVVK